MGGSARATGARLVVIEGIDGCGKTTQAKMLADRFGAVYTKEPGGTALGARLRDLLLDSGDPVGTRTELLLMLADRAQHVEELVQPTLERGIWVVCDRFSASTLAYQGHGAGLPIEEIRALDMWASFGREPDATVLLDIPVPDAMRRLAERGRPLDGMEARGERFLERVASGYRVLAAGDPAHWAIVDALGTREEVAGRVHVSLGRIVGTLPEKE